MATENQTIYDKNIIEFVTVAAEYCTFLENIKSIKQKDFIDKSLKILPLLYLKTATLPEIEILGDGLLEKYVTEDLYEILRIEISALLADKDDYLDTFVEDMKFSDQPIKQNISENLADIYQDLKDCLFVFQHGYDETMNDAIAICKSNFEQYWGQRLINGMKALHDAKYNIDETSYIDDNEEELFMD